MGEVWQLLKLATLKEFKASVALIGDTVQQQMLLRFFRNRFVIRYLAWSLPKGICKT